MNSPLYYHGSATLETDDFKLTITATVDDIPAADAFDPGLDSAVAFEVAVNHQSGDYKFSDRVPPSSEAHMDLLDLSICLTHLADKDDTTEEVAPLRYSTNYIHRVEWMIYQSFLDLDFIMGSKDTGKFKNKRFIDLLLPIPDRQYEVMILPSIVAVQKVRLFAVSLRDLHDQIGVRADLYAQKFD